MKNKKQEKIIFHFIGFILTAFLTTGIVGAVKFYSLLVGGLDWTGLSFFTFLILGIVFKVSFILQDTLDLMFWGKLRSTQKN